MAINTVNQISFEGLIILYDLLLLIGTKKRVLLKTKHTQCIFEEVGSYILLIGEHSLRVSISQSCVNSSQGDYSTKNVYICVCLIYHIYQAVLLSPGSSYLSKSYKLRLLRIVFSLFQTYELLKVEFLSNC